MSKSISFNLGELQEILNATLKGDPSCVVDNISTISNSNDSSISFVTDSKYKKYSKESKAAALIVSKDFTLESDQNYLICEDPYLSLIHISEPTRP